MRGRGGNALESAILTAVIFNAVIIILAIPPAPKLLLFGMGGVVAPFLGIKRLIC